MNGFNNLKISVIRLHNVLTMYAKALHYLTCNGLQDYWWIVASVSIIVRKIFLEAILARFETSSKELY